VKQPKLSAEQSQSFWQGALFAERFFMAVDEAHGGMRKLLELIQSSVIIICKPLGRTKGQEWMAPYICASSSGWSPRA
jgi:hypothetical protein